MNCRLALLLDQLTACTGWEDVSVSDLAMDSRQVKVGDAFVALQGGQSHGLAFASRAIAQGACVVLAESDASRLSFEYNAEGHKVPVIPVPRLREKLAVLCQRFYGNQAAGMTIVGVTGTNGKTSIVHMLAQALDKLGCCAGSIGTLGWGRVDHLTFSGRTTSDIISNYAHLTELAKAGVTHVAMEVSSHALAQGRVDGIAFDLAIFTNLTRDHLDYHGTMAAYGEAKAKLFAWPSLKSTVINVDDHFGARLASRTSVPCIQTAIEDDQADVRASDITLMPEGMVFDLQAGKQYATVRSALLGRFNVHNLLAVAAVLVELGYRLEQIAATLEQLQPVPGRMNRLGGRDGHPLLVVDYAHTPDALAQALSSLREHCNGKLVCVFGCGGERDTGKRPQMARLAEKLADRVIVTDDNPRHECGDAIVTQIMAGFACPDDIHVERDRTQAIHDALAQSRAGDVVLVAGKGHETYQEIKGHQYPFDDMNVARKAMEVPLC